MQHDKFGGTEKVRECVLKSIVSTNKHRRSWKQKFNDDLQVNSN